MKEKFKSQLIFLGCILVLTACDGGSGYSPPSAQSPAHRTTALEKGEAIPKFDRTDDLAGPDLNRNGVRDDVDSYINKRYLSAPQRAAALQVARNIQKQLLVSKTDKPALRLVSLALSRAVHCLFSKFEGDAQFNTNVVAQEIESMTANTKARLLAYLAFSKAADGTTSTIPEGDTCD